MSNEFFVVLFVLGVVAMSFQAYTMGWNAGHDIHHDDRTHGPAEPDDDEPPRPDSGLWV